MPVAAVAGLAFFVAFSLFLGGRMFLLARREGSLPELALAVAFVFSGGIAAAFQAVVPLELGPAWLQRHAFAVVRAGMDVGVACQMLFTWRVFRPHERWAAGVFAATLVLLAILLAGYASAGELANPFYRGPWFWAEVPVLVLGLAWGAGESLAYWAKMRRRLRLGMADPVVTNRFLLWGIAIAAGVVALALPPLFALFGQGGHAVLAGLTACAGLVALTGYALTFFPPRAWRRFVARRAHS